MNGWRFARVLLFVALALVPALAAALVASAAPGDTFTITASAGAGGSIDPIGAVSVVPGADQTFTITPNTGYDIADVLVDSVSQGAIASYKFTAVEADHTIAATFTLKSYTLTYSAGPGGTISGTTPQTVTHGANGTLVTAVPNTGYQFAGWSDGYPTAARTDLNVTGNITATATFTLKSYTLTYSAGPGGTISGTTPQTVTHGANGTLVTAVPNTGYQFAGWSDGYPTAARTDLNVTGNITATATFTLKSYTLTYSAGPGGTISGTTPQTVTHGANGTLVTAVPNTGYQFAGWSDGYPTAARTDLNVTGNITATATFTLKSYTLTYSAGPGGTISGTTPQTVTHGANGTLVTAVPNTGYQFAGWSDGYPTAARTDLNVTGNITATATFTLKSYTLTYSAGPGGTISGTTPQTVTHGANGTLVTAVPNTGYQFAGWSDGYPTAARTDLNVTGNITATATFTLKSYTLTYSAGPGGTISGTTPQTVTHGANGTLVTAVPNTGYQFAGWSDGYPTAARTDLNVTGNITATATFTLKSYTLTYSAGPGGTISGTTPQTVTHGANGTLVTAVPNTGYQFAGWSDGYPTAARTDLNVTGNITATATFTLKSYTIAASVSGSNGTISPGGNVSVNHGANQTFTFTPAANYHVANVLVDGVSVGALASYTFTNVTADHTISVSFAIDTRTLTYQAGPNGTISGTTPQTVPYGGNGTAVTAVPGTGYHFVNWSDGVLTATRTDLNVTVNKTVTANFAINTYTLTPAVGLNGTITPAAATTVDYGATQAFTITPSTGYHIADVLVDGVSVGAVTSYTFTNVNADHTISASFAIDTFTLTPTAGANGTVTPAIATTVNYGATQAFTITPATGYHVADVLVDGVSVGAVGTYTFANVIANHTISASFAINTYTLTPTAGANGTVTPAIATGVNYGATQAFTITPATGYHVADVLVDGVSVGAVTSYTFANVIANHTISASFAINTYTLTPTAGANGSISPGAVQTVDYGTSRTFTIAPFAGYYVADVRVDGVSVGPVPSYTFATVTADHTISASFAVGRQTRIAISVAKTIVDYGASTLLAGTLYDAGDPLNEVGMGGRAVTVQSSASATGPWADVKSLTTSSAAGSVGLCSLTVAPTTTTYYRLRFVAGVGSTYGDSLSFVVRVGVRPLLGTPKAPSSVRAKRSFTVYGTLRPGFPAGQKTVMVKLYRYKSRKWVFLREKPATNAASGAATRYSIRFKLTTRSYYRFRAYTVATPAWVSDVTALSKTLRVR